MSANPAETQETLDLQTLASAPPFVFLLIAAADGKVERKEMTRFAEALQEERHAILAAVMSQGGMPADALFAAAQQRLKDPLAELLALAQVIDTRLKPEVAAQFKAALISLASSVAEVSGGFFGRFTKKPGKTEAAMLTAITATFGLSAAATGSGETGSSETGAVESPLTDELFPALKAADWVEQAQGHVAMEGIFPGAEWKSGEPVIGYVQDRPQTLEFVPADALKGEVSIDAVRNRAMSNLDQRLAEAAQWHELNFDPGVDGLGEINGLVLIGDYFASEGLLSETMLKQAHERLDAALLMAIAPQRGELFVTKLVSEENPEPERILFAHFAIKKYFNPEQAPISPYVFIIRNGKLAGTIQGMDDIIDDARKKAEAEVEQEEELLQHTASITGTEEAFGLRVDVTALCVETMNKNLQHLLRAYVQKAVADDRFTGAVDVAVKIEDPAWSDEQAETERGNLANMAQFLNDQIASMNVKAGNGSPVTISCGLS